MENYLTLKDVAARLKVTKKTLYEWRRAGKIEFVKIGTRNRITTAELERFIEEGAARGNGWGVCSW